MSQGFAPGLMRLLTTTPVRPVTSSHAPGCLRSSSTSFTKSHLFWHHPTLSPCECDHADRRLFVIFSTDCLSKACLSASMRSVAVVSWRAGRGWAPCRHAAGAVHAFKQGFEVGCKGIITFETTEPGCFLEICKTHLATPAGTVGSWPVAVVCANSKQNVCQAMEF